MNQSASNERTAEDIYKEALAKIDAIAARYKKEVDEYMKEIDKEQAEKIKRELNA